jgi:hypothetical protein
MTPGDWHHDTQHNDTRYNDTQHNETQHNDTQHNYKETRHLAYCALYAWRGLDPISSLFLSIIFYCAVLNKLQIFNFNLE